MLSNLKNRVRAHLINYKGWSTKRKIVVFESDDWGAIRLPDITKIEEYRKRYPYPKNPYLKYDSLASEDDLNVLFSLISDCKDNFGNHPKLFLSNRKRYRIQLFLENVIQEFEGYQWQI